MTCIEPLGADRVFTITNVPIRVPAHFMGRDDALASIMAAFAVPEGRVAITTLHGLREWQNDPRGRVCGAPSRDTPATWWIRTETEPSIRADLVALGVRLGWITQANGAELALFTVMDRLRNEGEGILLIYDNAVDAHAIGPYLPLGGAARVLATSTAHAWRGIATPVEIPLWPKGIGADYLIVRTGAAAPHAPAEALSEMLGGLPLAHEQAAAYCERLDISLTEYRKRFEAAPANLLDDARHAPTEYHDGLTVAKTFGLAIDEAAKFHAAAEPLIVHAALLAPEPIPLFLFAEAHETLGDPLASGLAGPGVDEAVAALRAFAWSIARSSRMSATRRPGPPPYVSIAWCGGSCSAARGPSAGSIEAGARHGVGGGLSRGRLQKPCFMAALCVTDATCPRNL